MKIVHVRVMQVSEALNEDDGEMEGEYQIGLDDDVTDAERAGVALDVFHNEVPIGCLDDFDFEVVDEDGNLLIESEDYESYSGKNRGTLLDKID